MFRRQYDYKHILTVTAMLFMTVSVPHRTNAAELPPTEGRTNLASGKIVQYSPAPNYRLTSAGDTDATDLTDGKIGERQDREIWREASAVGWSYPGRVNLAMDLEQACDIDEVAIRFVGGDPQPGISIPAWVEVMVSDDGEHYRQVDTFSYFDDNATKRFNIPASNGKALIHCLRFKNLNTTGRWVGLRFYGSSCTVSDELYVFGRPTSKSVTHSPSIQSGTGFTITHPQIYFHKPYLVLATNLPLPQPIGIAVPAGAGNKTAGSDETLTMTLDLPPGVILRGSEARTIDFNNVQPEKTSDGWLRYQTQINAIATPKVAGRIYLQASDWEDGQTGQLRYQVSHGTWQSKPTTVPLRAFTIAPAAKADRLMLGIGWWSAGESLQWPDVLETWRTLGLNNFSVIGHLMMNKSADDPQWQLLEEARRQGFQILNIDSPYHMMLDRHKQAKELYCQFEDGQVGTKVCPSYRGSYYQEELDRFGKLIARLRPDHTSQDIELWGWRGPQADCEKCTRCRADFNASGLERWEQWLLTKGDQMWSDPIQTARKQLADAGHSSDFDTGGYDFRPSHNYQNVFSFDRLYPDMMSHGQVSIYTTLLPSHLAIIGDEIRNDRQRLSKSDILPWLTPGDAGTFPGHAFQWSLLECFTNGARGVFFWSSRVWDGETLLAFRRVNHAIADVEDIVIDGKPIDASSIQVIGPGRVSGMQRGDEIILLLADYHGQTNGHIELSLKLATPSSVRGLLDDNKRTIQTLQAGEQHMTVPLNNQAARLLHIHPSP